jgi:predicted DNA-binding transcriptional regulator AlpA
METFTLKEVEELLSISEASHMLGIQPGSIYQFITSGKLKPIHISKHMFFRPENVKEVVAAYEEYKRERDAKREQAKQKALAIKARREARTPRREKSK